MRIGNMQSSQEHLKTISCKMWGANRVYYGGFENRELIIVVIVASNI